MLQRFPDTLGWLAYNKPVLTAYYEDVNHTEMQIWRGGHSIHGNHGDKVLGCTFEWRISQSVTCDTASHLSDYDRCLLPHVGLRT